VGEGGGGVLAELKVSYGSGNTINEKIILDMGGLSFTIIYSVPIPGSREQHLALNMKAGYIVYAAVTVFWRFRWNVGAISVERVKGFGASCYVSQ
jgi:hypothetical protein